MAATSPESTPDDPRYELLAPHQLEGLERARGAWKEEGGVPKQCGRPVKRGRWAGQNCHNPAGLNTVHEGYGPCFAHGGAKLKGRVEGAWMAAHAFGQQLDINPWDALLMSVKIAAGKVAYCEYVIGTATNDLELEGRAVRLEGSENGGPGLLMHPDTGEPLGVGEYRDLSWWVAKGEIWHDRLAKCSKMAIDAGIAAWQVNRIEEDAQKMARVLNAVLDGLEGHISEEAAAAARSIMRNELLAIEKEEQVGKITDKKMDMDGAVVDSTGTWDA